MSTQESNLQPSELYINREISLLRFNYRVLELAEDPALPLLERLKYLCISSSNLDEFFEVRVAGVKQQIKMGIDKLSIDGLTAKQLQIEISHETHKLVDRQYTLLNKVLIPSLEAENIHFIRRSDWNKAQYHWVSDYFDEYLMPLLSPLGLDPAHPFPPVINKSLNFIVSLKGKDAFGREGNRAIVQAPRTLPRLIRLPASLTGSNDSFVFLSSIMHAFIHRLFTGMKVKGCFQFRVTRNSHMYLDEEEVDDLLKAMQGELPQRNYGDAVRLEVADECSENDFAFLVKQFNLSSMDTYPVNGPVNLNRLLAVHQLVARVDLKFPVFIPKNPLLHWGDGESPFDAIRQRDILLHHPYQSFRPVIDFIRQAGKDPNVLAIKQTLYRTGKNAEIVKHLVSAAREGKEVTAIIELRARFDEESNIELANQLQKASVQIVYGVVGFKTHAKLCMVTRKEDKIRHYVHLGTGNYHAGTATAYTDYGLFTCDPDIGNDVRKIFQLLTGLGRTSNLKYLFEAPFSLHQEIMVKIERETELARAGKTAHIMAKMNALIEPDIIQALYRASQAGVKIELIVRGVCCLRPGIKDISENIHVRSVMGRFLEHPRIVYFENAGEDELYLSSADWMPRNFFRRVETAFPILKKSLKKSIIEDSLKNYLKDNTQAWVLQENGQYLRMQQEEGEAMHIAQTALIDKLSFDTGN
jgi:polyphosphate kinase